MSEQAFRTQELGHKIDYCSEYKKHYKEEQPTLERFKESIENKNRLKKHNFRLGFQQDQMVSHSNTQFRDYNNKEQQNNEKRNMRVSNIILGNENRLGVSENMDQFGSKQKTQNLMLDKVGLRMHSHTFGDYKHDYKSINNVYLNNKLPNADTDQANQLKDNIRKTNIQLGFHNLPMQAPNDQNQKIQDQNQIMSNLRQHNFELGIDERRILQEGYNNLIYNKEKQLNYQNNSKESMLGQRVANFKLGDVKSQGQSEFKQEFKEYPPSAAQQDDFNHRKTNFNIECRVEPDNGNQTSYNNYHTQKQLQKKEDNKDELLKLRNASFILGYDPNNPQTEKQDQFSSKNDQCEKRLPIWDGVDKIHLGTDDNNFYTTNMREYKSKQADQYKITQEQISSLRSKNYHLGFNPESYKVPLQSQEIGRNLNKATRMSDIQSQQLAQNAKEDHVQIKSGDQKYYTTIYQQFMN